MADFAEMTTLLHYKKNYKYFYLKNETLYELWAENGEKWTGGFWMYWLKSFNYGKKRMMICRMGMLWWKLLFVIAAKKIGSHFLPSLLLLPFYVNLIHFFCFFCDSVVFKNIFLVKWFFLKKIESIFLLLYFYSVENWGSSLLIHFLPDIFYMTVVQAESLPPVSQGHSCISLYTNVIEYFKEFGIFLI